MIPIFVDFMTSVNEPRSLQLMAKADYVFITDQNKYSWLIYLHQLSSIFIVITIVLANDCLLVSVVQNAISMFAVLG